MPSNIHLAAALFTATPIAKLVCKNVCQKKQILKESKAALFPLPFLTSLSTSQVWWGLP